MKKRCGVVDVCIGWLLFLFLGLIEVLG